MKQQDKIMLQTAVAMFALLDVRDSSIPVLPRLLVNAAAQFGIAGAGITIVCLLRKERFMQFGLKRKNALRASLERPSALSRLSAI